MRNIGDSAEKSTLVPQAASSPKSDTYAMRSEYRDGRDTPALTHRSMSPTPTSQSCSWQKHSMQPNVVRNSSSIASQTPFKSMQRNISTSTAAGKDQQDSNYRPTQVSQIEDSYWKNVEAPSQRVDQTKVTPSSPKAQQEFYTARQFAVENIGVESLRVSSPTMQQSPSVRRHTNLTSFPLPEVSQTEARESSQLRSRTHDVSLAYEPSFAPIQSPLEHHTGLATFGNVTRSGSDHGSELSKVDSQASSLQRAISVALRQETTRDSADLEHHNHEKLPLDEAIAARFRQSRSTNCNENLDIQLDKTVPLVPREVSGPTVEPLKNASPLLDQTNFRRGAEDEDTSAVMPISKLKVADMLSALERVTEECSRRGQMLEAIVDSVGNPRQVDVAVVEALENADARSKHLEDQLRSYQIQVDQMSRLLKNMQDQGHPRSTAPADSVSEVRSTARTSCMRKQGPPAEVSSKAPQAYVQEREESLQDKFDRWTIQDPIAETSPAPVSVPDPIMKAHEILHRTPSMFQRVSRAPESESSSRRQNADTQTRSHSPLITPRHHQIAECSGLTAAPIAAQTTDRSKRLDETTGLRAELLVARAEIQELRRQQRSDSPAASPVIRPLTAEMMSDAMETWKFAGGKLYDRLRLGQIDHLGKVELANLIKNILIQLDIPYDELMASITSLGMRLEQEAQIHDSLWHETKKLRTFAENVHSTLYHGDHIQGAVTSSKCLRNMNIRVEKLQRALQRSQTQQS